MSKNEDMEEAWDDVKGGSLSIEDVRKARIEEVAHMEKRGIWMLRLISVCWEKTGKGPTSVRWVDTDKGIDEQVEVPSRKAARDFKGQIRGETIYSPRRLPLR